MKRLLGLLLLVPAIAFSVQDSHSPKGLDSKGYYDFSGGVDTYHSSLSLPDSYVANSLNVLFDANAPVSKRQGYTVSFSTKSYQFQTTWTYTDPTNTSWIIVRASDSIIANQLSGSTSVLIATASANNLVGETNANGNAYFVDQTQGVYYWFGTTTTVYVSGSPKGSLITQFHQRVWVAGAAVPNGNQLYGSKQNDGTTWTPNLNPNDPVQLTVGLQDNFDNITALYPFIDTLYVFKHYSTNALYGFDQTSFQISLITQECGCIDQQSIQTFNHGLDFVSERGVEFFDGYTCTRISNQVKNLVDPAIQAQGGSNIQSWIQSQTADWSAGKITPSGSLSLTLASPSLTVSSFSATENNFAQWSLGSASSISVNSTNLELATNNIGTVNEPGFEVGPVLSNIEDANWTSAGISHFIYQTSIGNGSCTITPHTGTYMAEASSNKTNLTVIGYIMDVNNNVLYSQALPFNDTGCAWVATTLSDPLIAGVRVKFKFELVNQFIATRLQTVQSYIFGGTLNFLVNVENQSANAAIGYFIDDISGGSSTVTSGSFTSQTYNTGISSPTYQLSNLSYIVATATPTFDLQTASNSTTGPWTEILTSSSPLAVGQQYVKYTSTITIGSGDSANTAITAVSLAAVGNGTLNSQSHSLSGISSFGNFSVQDALNGGNIGFNVCTSSSVTMVTSTCTFQVPNAQITVATNSFVNFQATFTVTAATQTPTLNSVSVQFFSGSRSPPMSSTIWDNRYWLSLTTNTADNFNDATLVLNSKNAWSIFGIHAGGFTQYKGSLYHSDSLASGNVYLDNQGYNDNGVPINAFIQTKDLPQGDLTEDDYFDSIYPSMDNLGNFNVEISYYMDRNYGTPYTLSTVNQSEFASNGSVKIPFTIYNNNQNFGKTITYLFQATDLGEPWNFYGFTHYFHTRPAL